MTEKYRSEAPEPPPPPPPDPVRYTWREWWVLKRAEIRKARPALRAACKAWIKKNWGITAWVVAWVLVIATMFTLISRNLAALGDRRAECARLCWPKPHTKITSPSDKCYCNINAEAPALEEGP